MRADHLVDPELRPLLDLLPRAPVDRGTLYQVRAQPPFVSPRVETPTISSRQVAATARDGHHVLLHVYTPIDEGPTACILHFHGGGFVMGAAVNQEVQHRVLAEKLRCAIVSVDYRLAPETAYPGALDDGYAALAWIDQHAEELGIDRRRVGVMGESAGGGLAAAVALLARDRGEYPLAFQHLHYPMLDDRTGLAAAPGETRHFVWGAESNRFGWGALLGHEPGGADVSPYAAPARATDFAALPPTFLMTGELDLFLEEDMLYASRLLAAGVSTELHVYPGAFHVFDLSPDARVARAARRDSLDALRHFTAART